jgi:hypothetical protein
VDFFLEPFAMSSPRLIACFAETICTTTSGRALVSPVLDFHR